MQKKEHRIFVYGSLRRGQSYHHLLQNAVFEGTAHTLPQYHLLDLGWYPGVVGGGHTSVTGEIFRVCAALCAQLDAYEDHPRLFRRTVAPLPDGSEVEIYLYVAPVPAQARAVETGDWALHRKP